MIDSDSRGVPTDFSSQSTGFGTIANIKPGQGIPTQMPEQMQSTATPGAMTNFGGAALQALNGARMDNSNLIPPSALTQQDRNNLFDSAMPQAIPGFDTGVQSNFSQYQPAPGFVDPNAPQMQAGPQGMPGQSGPMSFQDYQRQMFGGGPSVADQMQAAMYQQAQHQNKMQVARGILQKVGVAAAGALGGPAAMAAAAQGMQQHNYMRGQNQAAQYQAQMDMLKFAADNDPNSFKNRMAAAQGYQQYANQYGDNRRADATLAETGRHNLAGETQATSANDLAQAQLKYNMSNDTFKNWLETQKFGAQQSNDASTRQHQANVDSNALAMQGHTLAQDSLANKRADAQIGYQGQQLANANRTYSLQANAQDMARQDKKAEVIFDKNGKPQAKYDYSRLAPAAPKPQVASTGNPLMDFWNSFTGAQPAQAAASPAAQIAPSVNAGQAAARAELKRRGLI